LIYQKILIHQIVQYFVHNATKDTIKKGEIQLLCFKFVDKTTIINNRGEVKIKINLEYYLSHILYQHITNLSLSNITFSPLSNIDRINKAKSIRD
jgi:hypothetical protein